MKSDPETGALIPFDFNDIYEEFPYIIKLGVDIESIMLKPRDSSNITPEDWVKLATIIRDNYKMFDGFVVLHGTDTMSYTASALSFMFENLDKPVVFTGSQIPIGVMRTDGRENLITAIEIAAAKQNGVAVVPEVCLCFQNRLFRANRTFKYSAQELNAFRSDNYPTLADVGINIQYNKPFIYTAKSKTQELKVCTTLETSIVVVKLFPGISPDVFNSLMNITGVKGVVLETYGAGNAPSYDWFVDIVADTVKRGVTVVNVTQCSSGAVAMDLYETGVKLKKVGVVSGHDSTTEAAVTKLMYLLGIGLCGDSLKGELRRSIRGEITV